MSHELFATGLWKWQASAQAHPYLHEQLASVCTHTPFDEWHVCVHVACANRTVCACMHACWPLMSIPTYVYPLSPLPVPKDRNIGNSAIDCLLSSFELIGIASSVSIVSAMLSYCFTTWYLSHLKRWENCKIDLKKVKRDNPGFKRMPRDYSKNSN